MPECGSGCARGAHSVMPGLVPGIHVFAAKQDVDGRDKPGQAKPSQAKPSQAKPSQAKPSPAMTTADSSPQAAGEKNKRAPPSRRPERPPPKSLLVGM